MKIIVILAALLCLSACASRPYAIIDGSRSIASDPENVDVIFIGIDGKMYPNGFSYKTLEPGVHLLQVATSKAGWRNAHSYLPFMLNAEPCKRYILTAQHDNSLTRDDGSWSVNLLRVEPVESCLTSHPEVE